MGPQAIGLKRADWGLPHTARGTGPGAHGTSHAARCVRLAAREYATRTVLLPPIVARNGVSGHESPSMFHVKQAGARWESTAANHTLQTLQRTHKAIC